MATNIHAERSNFWSLLPTVWSKRFYSISNVGDVPTETWSPFKKMSNGADISRFISPNEWLFMVEKEANTEDLGPHRANFDKTTTAPQNGPKKSLTANRTAGRTLFCERSKHIYCRVCSEIRSQIYINFGL